MTDAEKVEALAELLGDIIHRLGMKSYEIDDATESHKCEIEADEYHDQMLKILNDVTVDEVSQEESQFS